MTADDGRQILADPSSLFALPLDPIPTPSALPMAFAAASRGLEARVGIARFPVKELS